MIGQGFTSTVWEATNLLLKERVAVKILHRNLRLTHEEQFLSEALLGRLLQCDRLVPVFDVGRTISGQPFMTMPIADSFLADRLSEKVSMTEEEYISMCTDLFCATQYLHSNDIVHLDINPSNIAMLQSPTPRWCLADLGLTQYLDELPAKGSGTLGFSAPERLTETQLTPAADMYSLGKTLQATLPLVRCWSEYCLSRISQILESLTASWSVRVHSITEVVELFAGAGVNLNLGTPPNQARSVA
jgi:serine/threonine protein kinase